MYGSIPDEESGLMMSCEGGGQGRRVVFPQEHVVFSHGTRHRLINRNGHMGQSTGRVFVRKRIKKSDWWALYGTDWFHSLVDAPTWRVVTVLCGGYLFIVWIFAVMYYAIQLRWGCNLDFNGMVGAFDFTIETMATIGYGTQDIYFDDCWSACIVLAVQMCVRLIVEGLSIGIVYCRLSRPHARASTLIFSQRAVIRRIRGKLYFMFQLCELRKHQLVEAHVRLYIVRKEVDRSGEYPHPYLHTSSMRLNHPNDELGSMLLLMVPQIVVHELDISSPLMPPPVWISVSTGETISWDPPCYRHLKRKMQPTAFSLGTNEEHRHSDDGDHDGMHVKQGSLAEGQQLLASFDPEALSSLEFPNVTQRGSTEAVSSSSNSVIHSSAMSNASEISTPIASRTISASPLVSYQQAVQFSMQTPPPRPRGLQNPANLTPPPTVGIADDRLESPGLTRYCRDMQVGLQGTAFTQLLVVIANSGDLVCCDALQVGASSHLSPARNYYQLLPNLRPQSDLLLR